MKWFLHRAVSIAGCAGILFCFWNFGGKAVGGSVAETPTPIQAEPIPNEAGPSNGLDTGEGVVVMPLSERLLRLVSSRLRRLEGERDRLLQELAALPHPPAGPPGGTLGFHDSPDQVPNWVQVDLQGPIAIDAVVLIPANVVLSGHSGPGYGFPLRFRVDVSDDPEFESFETLLDNTQEDFSNPGASPIIVPAGKRVGRFVRVTATKLWGRRSFGADYRLFAMAELVVLQGNRNVAVGMPVRASNSLDSPETWGLKFLVDGQSPLGYPVGREASPSNGYHSINSEKDPNAVKWVQVDLKQSALIDEVRLIPARPPNFADIRGFGFPIRFRVEISNDPSFRNPTVLRDCVDTDFPNPGDNPVFIPVAAAMTEGNGASHYKPSKRPQARYVRVTATRLRESSDGVHPFALSELQVYSGDENIALGADVDALDSIEKYNWSPDYLVDGFSSLGAMMEYPEWLEGLVRHFELQGQLQRTLRNLEGMLHLAVTTVSWVGGTVLTVGLVVGIVMVRSRSLRRRELEHFRTRVSRDLHDELGASLTQIGMLTDLAKHDAGDSEALKNHTEKIAGRVLSAIEALDEVVWAVDPKNDRCSRLAGYLSSYAEQFFSESEIRCRLDIDAQIPNRQLSSQTCHHVMLAAKEALTNSLKHSSASEVWLRILVVDNSFQVQIEDDGVGFSLNERAESHHGLGNIKKRILAVGGTCEIVSQPNQGCCVTLAIPLT